MKSATLSSLGLLIAGSIETKIGKLGFKARGRLETTSRLGPLSRSFVRTGQWSDNGPILQTVSSGIFQSAARLTRPVLQKSDSIPGLLDQLVNAQDAIDLNAVVTTPENIRFEYRIAGPFRRLPALILDFAIRIAFFFGLMILAIFAGVAIRVSGGILSLVFLIAWFALDWFYGLFFETFWNGQTIGKWLTKIRVISVDGRPINAYQATVRNFLRLADFAPLVSLEIFSPNAPPMYIFPTLLVSLICMLMTSRFQRLGDLAAGTMVVVNVRAWVPPNIKLEDSRIAALSEFIPPNFRMSATLAKAIALYVERRSRIPMARRIELASYIAKPLLKRFDFREDTSPDLLLCALYYREFVLKDVFTDKRGFSPPPPMVSNSIPSNPLPNPSVTNEMNGPISLPPLLNSTEAQ